MNTSRVLAAAILAIFVVLLLAIIWRQQKELEKFEEAKRELGRIIEENNELKGQLVECAEGRE